MKRERRHELQHNELADWLAKAIERLTPYQNVIFAAVVLVIVAAVGYAVISRNSQKNTTLAWDAINNGLETGNPSTFTRVMDEYPNTNVANVAAVVAADLRLAEGCNRLFNDKALAEQQLSQAIELYGKELDGGNPALHQRATFGLARAWEAEGDLDKANRRYKEVVDNWPDGAFAAAAKQRLDDLKRPAIIQLYRDLRKFNPKPVASPESELPGDMPSFAPDGLPSNPPHGPNDINFENLGGKAKEQQKSKETEKPKEKGKK